MYIGDIWHKILIIYETILINHNLKKERLSETKVKSCAIHVFTNLVWNSQRLKKVLHVYTITTYALYKSLGCSWVFFLKTVV